MTRKAEMPDEFCPARYPITGHQCELTAGHDADVDPVDRHHDRIMAGGWIHWCDYPLTCDEPDCDNGLDAHRRDAAIKAAVASSFPTPRRS